MTTASANAGEAPSIGLRAGAAKLVTTPPFDVHTWGKWSPLRQTQDDVHDDLYARALVLERSNGSAGGGSADNASLVAIVACDTIGFGGRAFVDGVRRRVSERTCIPPAHVLLAATHTHNSPWTLRRYDVDIDLHWLDVWERQLADVVAMAHRRLRPARLAWGSARLEVAENRRVVCADGRVYRNWQRPPPAPVVRQGPIDPALTVLVAEDHDGQPIAVLANYTMHPVTAMSVPVYSADFPGVAVRLVERAFGDDCIALFTNGAAGDVNPPEVRRNLDDTAQMGRIVGGAIVQAGAALHRSPSMTGDVSLAGASTLLHPPFREAPSVEASLAALEKLDTASTPRGALLATLREYQVALLAQEAEPLEVQALRVGGLALVGVPGELFVEIGLRIKADSPAPLTAVAGYANDWQGYFPTPGAFDEGAYEVDLGPHSRYTAAAGAMIHDAAGRLLRDLFPAPA